MYCLPILKRETHRQALLRAACSGNKKFFLGTDSAPHVRASKESGCGCAGIYSAHAAIELYAEAFDEKDSLQNLRAFAAENGADFYGLPRNAPDNLNDAKEFLVLKAQENEVAKWLPFGGDVVVPLRAGEMLKFKAERVIKSTSEVSQG